MRLTTIDNVLSKLVRDYPLQEEPSLAYVREWVREALLGIDNYDQWEKKSLEVTVKDYRTPIPTDFYSFDKDLNTIQAREQGSDLYVNIRDGKLTLHYLAFPTDAHGVILLPDTIEYLDAVCYYCVARMCRKRMIENDKEFNYENYHNKYLNKKVEARADLHLRNQDAQEQFASDFHDLTRGLEQPRNRYGRTR